MYASLDLPCEFLLPELAARSGGQFCQEAARRGVVRTGAHRGQGRLLADAGVAELVAAQHHRGLPTTRHFLVPA